jgi:hypothetical protein
MPRAAALAARPADPLVWSQLYVDSSSVWICLITLWAMAFLSWVLLATKSQRWERMALSAPVAVLAPLRVLYLLAQLRLVPFPLPAWVHAMLNSLPIGCSHFISTFCHGRMDSDDEQQLCLRSLTLAALHVCGLAILFHSVYTQPMLAATKSQVALIGTYWQCMLLAHCAQNLASVAAAEWSSVALRDTLWRFGVLGQEHAPPGAAAPLFRSTAAARASTGGDDRGADPGLTRVESPRPTRPPRPPMVGLRGVVLLQLCCVAVQITCCIVSYHAPQRFRNTFALAQGSFLLAELLFVYGAHLIEPASIASWVRLSNHNHAPQRHSARTGAAPPTAAELWSQRHRRGGATAMAAESRRALVSAAARQLAASRRPGWQGGSVPPGVPPRPAPGRRTRATHATTDASTADADGSWAHAGAESLPPPPHAPPPSDGSLAAKAA